MKRAFSLTFNWFQFNRKSIIKRSENKIVEKVILSKISISPKVVYMMYEMNRMCTQNNLMHFFKSISIYKTYKSNLCENLLLFNNPIKMTNTQ